MLRNCRWEHSIWITWSLVSSVQMCKVNTLDCPGCCSTRMWCPANPSFSACMSMFPSFPYSLTGPVSSALKPCCKSWQLRKMAWMQIQPLGNNGAPLTSVLVTMPVVHKWGLASTSCSKETHVHWHKPMNCTIWGQQCVRDVMRATHVCSREQLFFLFWWTNNWKMQPPTSVELLLRTIFSSESRQAVEVGSLPLLMFVCLQAAWEAQFKWAALLCWDIKERTRKGTVFLGKFRFNLFAWY